MDSQTLRTIYLELRDIAFQFSFPTYRLLLVLRRKPYFLGIPIKKKPIGVRSEKRAGNSTLSFRPFHVFG